MKLEQFTAGRPVFTATGTTVRRGDIESTDTTGGRPVAVIVYADGSKVRTYVDANAMARFHTSPEKALEAKLAEIRGRVRLLRETITRHEADIMGCIEEEAAVLEAIAKARKPKR